MANRRKIIRDRKFPDASQINSQQDFARLMKNHKLVKNLMIKKIILWSAVTITAAVVGITAVLYNQPEKKLASQPTPVKDTTLFVSCIKAPLPGKEMDYKTYMIDNTKGGTFKHETGTEIVIPAGAFVREDGSVPEGEVRIRYREFHTPLDVFLSGIPMSYDSAGTSRTFETAGMLEILAFDGDKPLQLDLKKQIDVTMASATADTKFNLYSLDTLSGHWTYRGKDEVVKPSHGRKPQSKPVTLAKETKAEPIMPKLANPKKFNFSISYDKNEFPELDIYNNILFEVADESFKSQYFKIRWDKISLEKSEDDHYTINLLKADTTIKVSAHPVFSKEEFDQAQEKFEKAQADLQKKEALENTEKAAKLGKLDQELGATNRELMVTARTMVRLTTGRRFSLSTVGVHNLDYPMPDEFVLAMRLTEATRGVNGAPTYSSVYLVEKGKNAVFTFQKDQPLRFNPSAQNLIWTVMSDGQIAFFSVADLNRMKRGDETTSAPVRAADQDAAIERIRKFSEAGA